MLNPAKKSMKQYLDLIRPWCVGEWSRADFASEKAIAYRLDPSHVIFPIPTRSLPGMFEQFFLGAKRTAALMLLISWVNRFNATLTRVNIAPIEEKMELTIMLHEGIIGRTGSGTLHDVFDEAERSL